MKCRYKVLLITGVEAPESMSLFLHDARLGNYVLVV